MPPVNLTTTKVEALKPRTITYRVADAGRRGFVAVVYPSGKKAFAYRYKLRGVQSMAHLGDVPDTDLADAHLEYERLRKLVRKGIDPKAPLPADDAGPSFGDVAEAWYQSHCLAKVKNAAGQWIRHPNKTPLKAPKYKKLQLDLHLLPHWKDRPLKAIERLDANRRLDEIVAAGSPVMANRVGATIGQLWAWALDEGVLPATPMQGLGKRGGVEVSRDRTLTDDQLRQFWTKLETAELSAVTVAALRFCLVTGARRAEVAGARWAEISDDVWTIPASRAKSNKAHIIPLSDLALEILESVRGQHSTAVFPSPTEGTMRPHSLSRAINRKLKHFGIGKFTPHDLRRTLRSKLAELGVSSVVAKKCLNHALEGMDAVYDRHEYADEKAEAFQQWADHLRAVVESRARKVVPIKKRK